MSTLERAIAIAAEAHSDKVDKGGNPYFLHPLRVMLAMPDDESRIVAVLHDVVEDHGDIWPLERIRAEGFPETVIVALNLVTHQKPDGDPSDEEYMSYVKRVAANPIGRLVKLADLKDNCDLSRISNPTARDFARIEKYRRAIAVIEQTGS